MRVSICLPLMPSRSRPLVHAWSASLCLALCSASACGGDGDQDTATPSSSSASSGFPTTGDGEGESDDDTETTLDPLPDLPPPTTGEDGTAEGGGEPGCKKVDFLFVIDNSGSMLEEQQALIS